MFVKTSQVSSGTGRLLSRRIEGRIRYGSPSPGMLASYPFHVCSQTGAVFRHKIPNLALSSWPCKGKVHLAPNPRML